MSNGNPIDPSVVEELNEVVKAIESVTKLESDLQQLLGKSESPTSRKTIAVELADAVGAHERLVTRRGQLLASLNVKK